MLIVLTFSVTLLIAVLISDFTRRSVLSTSVLFLASGIAVNALGWISLQQSHPMVQRLAEIALVATLFGDAIRLPARDFVRAWQLPGRALILGMPLTMVLTTLLARLLMGMDWTSAMLVAAALSPTDPVFASAIVGQQRVPHRLRHLLNVESGLNDGIALPAVMILLATLQQGEHASSWHIGLELLGGAAIGIIVPILAVLAYRRPWFGAAPLYKPMFGLAIGLIVWSLASVVHANSFIGAFAAGVTLATVSEKAREHFEPVGERVAEVFKLAALLLFGILITTEGISQIGIGGWSFAAGLLVVARPVAILLSLLWSGLPMRERLVAAWFGPRGFASVVFGLLIADSGIPHAQFLFAVIAATVALSIVAHASTDVVVARWFDDVTEQAATPADPAHLS